MDIYKKNILITGASSGIGSALATLLSRAGNNVAILARRKHELLKIGAILTNDKSFVLPVECDVTNKEEVKTAIQKAKNAFGSIDIAILNSGVSYKNKIEEFDSELGKKTFDINVGGLMNCVEYLIPDMMEKREGTIVGVSSLAEGRGFTKSGFYSASKAAASIFLESLRNELHPYNIKVITVKPGFVKTPMTDKNEFKMPFLMSVDKAANIILKGLKKDKKIIQFPLQTVILAKTAKLMPDFLFDKIARKLDK